MSRLAQQSGFFTFTSKVIGLGNVPWRADCLPQTIAARMLLRRCGCVSAIHIGVARIGDDGLAAHACLTCEGTVVAGGTPPRCYTELHVLSG